MGYTLAELGRAFAPISGSLAVLWTGWGMLPLKMQIPAFYKACCAMDLKIPLKVCLSFFSVMIANYQIY